MAPYRLCARKLRLLIMKTLKWKYLLSNVLRSACLTLMAIVYHKIFRLYTLIFRLPSTAVLLTDFF